MNILKYLRLNSKGTLIFFSPIIHVKYILSSPVNRNQFFPLCYKCVINYCLSIGSRIDKSWFRVKDNKIQVDRMLTIMPYNPQMVLPFTRGTCKTLKELFSVVQVALVMFA